jgi:hypothetical protein
MIGPAGNRASLRRLGNAGGLLAPCPTARQCFDRLGGRGDAGREAAAVCQVEARDRLGG